MSSSPQPSSAIVALTDLRTSTCKACRSGEPAIDTARAGTLLDLLPKWARDGDKITRTFSFENYYETMAFVNAIAWMAHQQDHHPDLEVSYNRCRVRYSTHAVGGLSENDFICAAKVDAMIE